MGHEATIIDDVPSAHELDVQKESERLPYAIPPQRHRLGPVIVDVESIVLSATVVEAHIDESVDIR